MRTSKRHALFWAALFLFLVALVLHSRQVYHMSVAAALLWPLSMLLGRHKLAGLRAIRSAPQVLQAGAVADVVVRVTNPTTTRRLFVEVTDELPNKALGGDPHFLAPVLQPGVETEFRYPLRTSLRGVYRIGPIVLTAADTLGLTTFSRRFDELGEVIVCPTPVNLPPLWPVGATGRRSRKTRRAVGHDGSDFYNIREYIPGDDLRRIHWKTTARTDKLMAVQFSREQSLEGNILLDLYQGVHSGEGASSTLEQGVILAATAARQAQLEGADVGLIAIGNEDYSVPVSPAVDQYAAILEALAYVSPVMPDNWLDAVIERLAGTPRRCAMLVISPRTDEAALTVARQLVARGQIVSWIVLHPTEASHTTFIGQLRSLGCRTRTVNCSLPLQAQFGTGQRAYVRA